MHDIDYDEVRRLRAMEMPSHEIGRRLGTSEYVIAKIVRKLGLPALTNRTRQHRVDVPTLFATWNDSRLTVTEVAGKLGIPTGYLYKLARRHGLPEREHQHRSGSMLDGTPEDDAASSASLAFSPFVARRIEELGLGMPKAEAREVPAWASVATETEPDEWEEVSYE